MIRGYYKALLPVLAALFCFIFVPSASAQRSAGEEANIDPLYLIDAPVAGVLPTTSGSIETYLYPNGGVLTGVTYGLFQNFNVGVFYGGTGIIGSGGIDWNNFPGVMARYRFFEENEVYPAMVIGFDSQGKDGFISGNNQYVIKSPGFFLTASKNYMFHGTISFHSTLNYTLERNDGDKSPNLIIGCEKSVGPLVSFLSEYNFALDNDKGKRGFWNGNLSLGARISTNIGFNISLYFKNLLTSDFYYNKIIREIYIQYVRYI